MQRSVAAILLLATALVVPLGGDALAAELWRWIDAQGVPRYTPDPDQVPSSRRSTLERVEPGMAAVQPREPAPAPPTAIFAPPGDPAIEADPFNEPERAREITGEVVEGELVVELPAPGAAQPVAPATPDAAAPLHSVDAPPVAARVEAPAAPPRTVEAPVEAPVGPVSAAPSAPPEYQGEVLVDLHAPEPATRAQVPREAAPDAAAPEALRSVDAGPAAAPAAGAADRAARRAELVAAIARDEEALKAHVSTQGAGQLVASPELRQIAERLPALQAELRDLDAQGSAP